jgi:hypothetical protein
MAFVDHSIGNNENVRFRAIFPRVRFWIMRALRWPEQASSALISFLAYLAAERGATSSASVLVMGGLAAAGAVLHQAWSPEIDDSGTRPLFCERGCLRRLMNDLQLKAADELRLHQDIFGRRFNYRHIELRGGSLDGDLGAEPEAEMAKADEEFQPIQWAA